MICIISIISNAQNLNENIKNGLKLANDKKYNEAIEAYTKALEIDNRNAEIYFQRGMAKFELKDYYGTIKDLEKTIQYKPADKRYIFLAYYTLGLANFNLNRNKLAIAYLDSAQNIEPQNPDIYFERGKAKINLGNINDGCEDFSLAGELGAKNVYELIQKYCGTTVLSEDSIEWIKYGETVYYSAYYNPKIIKVSENVFKISTKRVINEENYNEAKEYMFGYTYETKYKNLKYMIVDCSVDISKGEIRDDEAELFNRDNSAIEKHYMEIAYKELKIDGWQKPLKGSLGPNLIEIVRIRYKE